MQSQDKLQEEFEISGNDSKNDFSLNKSQKGSENSAYADKYSNIQAYKQDKQQNNQESSELQRLYDNQDEENLKKGQKLNNNWQTFFTIFKLNMTTAWLSTPIGFKRGGWLFSVLCLLFYLVLSIYCMIKVVKTRVLLNQKLTYGQIGQLAYGRVFKYVTDIFVFIVQITVTMSYVIFIVKEFEKVIDDWFSYNVKWWQYFIALIILLTPLCLYRKLPQLTKYFIFGIFILYGTYIFIFAKSIQHIAEHGAGKNIDAFNEKDFLIFLGMACFMFEGIGAILPTFEATADKKSYTKLMALAMISVGILQCLTGIFYIAYGDDTDELITLNLKQNTPTQVCIIAVCGLIALTYPLQQFPISEIIESYIQMKWYKDSKTPIWVENFARIFMVIFTVVVGYVLRDKLDKLFALAGCVSGAPLMFVFPCLIYLKFNTNITKKEKIIDWSVIVIGVITLFLTLVVTIVRW